MLPELGGWFFAPKKSISERSVSVVNIKEGILPYSPS
jgi:hypothetical protein